MSLSRGHKPPEPKVDINIVPLVDVALVLLIIFMVTTTFEKTAGLQMQLPTSESAQPVDPEKRELVIAVAADGAFRWMGTPVEETALAGALKQEAAQHGVASRVTIQGDKRAAHGHIVRAMTLAQLAGFSKLMISTTMDGDAHGK